MISLQGLVADWLLRRAEVAGADKRRPYMVDYRRVERVKLPLLTLAHSRFKPGREFDSFCKAQAAWLHDYAVFMAIKESRGGKPWWTWPEALRFRRAEALRRVERRLASDIQRHKFLQVVFFRQWRTLKAHAHARGVRLVGDMPIYVAHDSADVWAYPENFLLDRRRKPLRVAGVPPDFFSRTGQLWGNPVYDWNYLRKTKFAWWEQRLRANLALYDIVRFDHFRAFAGYWGVPYGHRTAIDGRWYKAPGAELFGHWRRVFGTLDMIVEDLGMITPDVRKLRDDFHLPGMKILHYAFGGGADSEYLPHNYARNFVVYTGTHDNDTTRGWYASAPENVKRHARAYVGDGVKESAWPLIRLAWQSVAGTAIVPMQDLLDLGTKARMNVPGTTVGNWRWRMGGGELTAGLAARLKGLTVACGR